MFNFFSKKDKPPAFRILWTFEKRNHYFVRNAEWGKLDADSIFVNDPKTLKAILVNEWQQYIFLAATGKETVTNFIQRIATNYSSNAETPIDQIVIYEMLSMADHTLIVFTQQSLTIPVEFDKPLLQ
jgi:hypothetical protein